MRLTDEQKHVVDHEGDARVISVAGSGKTATLLEYCRKRPKAKVLYLVYNRATKMEAIHKFKAAGLNRVKVETSHSLSYREYGVKQDQLHPKGNYRTVDMARRPELAKSKKDDRMVLAHHVLEIVNCFCNSDVAKLEDLDYVSCVRDPQSRAFAREHEDMIRAAAYGHLKDMYQGVTPLVHDAYLKFWSLSRPKLDCEYLLTDESQDHSGVTLGLVTSQAAPKKIMVGDNAQQLYAFRHAVNSLDRVDYPLFKLSCSFRFDQHIADLAMKALRLKALLGLPGWDMQVKGMGTRKDAPGRAVIARGNLALVARCIEEILGSTTHRPHFEGGLQSYTHLNEGSSIFDVLYLQLGRPDRVRDELIGSFNCYDDLVQYQSETGDRELGLMIEMVSKYGSSLFDYLRMLKENQTEKAQADVTFGTCHRCKGMEYGTVALTEDFINADRIQRMIKKASEPPARGEKPRTLDLVQINEEINILYVAITRAISSVCIPFSIDETRPQW